MKLLPFIGHLKSGQERRYCSIGKRKNKYQMRHEVDAFFLLQNETKNGTKSFSLQKDKIY